MGSRLTDQHQHGILPLITSFVHECFHITTKSLVGVEFTMEFWYNYDIHIEFLSEDLKFVSLCR